MMDREEPRYTEEQAAAIWRRAARLQMEAAQRLEERSRSLVVRAPGEDQTRTGGSLRQSDVEAAAQEAGISAEYVQLAQAELQAQAGSGDVLEGWEDRAATRFLRTGERSIELSRLVAAPAAAVIAAMQRVFPAHPYYLALRDVVGGDPTDGGVLVFSMPAYNMSTSYSSQLALHAAAVDLKQVLVRVLPGAGEGTCELVLTGDMHFGVRRNWRVGATLSGVVGTFGGGVGAAVAVKAFAVAGGLVLLPAVGAFAAVAGLGALGYGAAYRYYLRKLTDDLEELLQRVSVDARLGGAFAPPAPPPAASGRHPAPTVLPPGTSG